MTFIRRVVLRAATPALLALAIATGPDRASAQPFPPGGAGAATDPESPALRQTQADDYTRYELLDPASRSFRIVYEVTATTPGAKYFWNPIRKGSTARNESVADPASGLALKFVEVSGADARTNGFGSAELDTRYLQIELPRPVPKEGEVRVLIDKTYKDEKSYFIEENTGFLVFSRSLGVKRNAVVLPVGYEVVACNYPSQVFTEPAPAAAGPKADMRVRMSFMNIGPDAVSYVVKARKAK